jgi:hypothetical protein
MTKHAKPGRVRAVVRRPDPDRRLLCHECAQRNHWAFYQLLYRVRGEHVCENCGCTFRVRFTPNSVIDVTSANNRVSVPELTEPEEET